MSNNNVDLSGYVRVDRVEIGEQNGEVVPAVTGWVFTDSPVFGGKHPFTASGKPAQFILEYARQAQEPGGESGLPLAQLVVSLQGKLVSQVSRSVVAVRRITFFDNTFPVLSEGSCLAGFAQNTVRMQGFLTVCRESAAYRVVSFRVPVVDAWLATDEALSGGHHPVLLSGQLAGALRRSLAGAFEQSEQVTLPVMLCGKLFSLRETCYVQAHYLSIGREGGARVLQQERSRTPGWGLLPLAGRESGLVERGSGLI